MLCNRDSLQRAVWNLRKGVLRRQRFERFLGRRSVEIGGGFDRAVGKLKGPRGARVTKRRNDVAKVRQAMGACV